MTGSRPLRDPSACAAPSEAGADVDEIDPSRIQVEQGQPASDRFWPGMARLLAVFMVCSVMLAGIGAASAGQSHVLVLTPGPVVDTGTHVNDASGQVRDPDSGALLLLTVHVEQASGLRGWWKRVSDSGDVLTRTGTALTAVSEADQMRQSEQDSSAAATALVHDLGLSSHLAHGLPRVDVGDVQGPSAGLVLTLVKLEQLTGSDLTGGRRVAVTGTVDALGRVGVVGGLKYKLAAAATAGASLALVPAGTAEPLHAHPGLDVLHVASVADAVHLLCLQGGTGPICRD